MTTTARELAVKLDGEVEGKEDRKITHPAKIEEAVEGAVSFIANPKYVPYLQDTKASVLIVPKELEVKRPEQITFIRVDDAYNAFTRMLKIFAVQPKEQSGVSKFALVDPSAKLGENVTVGHYSVIGPNAEIADNVVISDQVNIGAGVKIGRNSRLHAGVKVYHGCEIGNDCILHAGVVVGSDGFGFAPQKDGTYEKIPQTGNVVVSSNVEIGANTTIDRATMGSTIIGKGVKIDNLVQIAHNVEIGDYTVVAAQAGISGSTKIGKYCQVGGQAGFVGHIKIADRVGVNAQSGVSKSVEEPGAKLTGSPAWDYQKSLRAQAVHRKLPEMEERLRKLEKLIISHSQEKNE